MTALIRCAAVAAALVPLAAAAPAADARDAIVPSFDRTPLTVTLHPAAGPAAGRRAPTILKTHGWAGSRATDPEEPTDERLGGVGVGPLRRAGFNVLTWDSRGFGDSGGVVGVNGRAAEGRDVRRLLSWLADQPEALLDAPGDPRVGMHGVSYGGGIELTAAAIDRRIDAIAPAIAWHSLRTSLYRAETVKGGWAGLLYLAGETSAGLAGLDSPAGPQTGGLDPHIGSAYRSGLGTGTLSEEDRAWFISRGPARLVRHIRVPTMLIQGTADTLFTPSEALRNARALRGRVPLKMVWFCGGHGTCLTGQGPAGHVEARVLAWLRRHVAGERRVRTGAAFEWLADDAVWRSSRRWPVRRGRPLRGTGSGTLTVSPAGALSGNPVAAAPALEAVEAPIRARAAEAVGEPVVTLAYRATGTGSGHVFAQIVDRDRDIVLGNQVTPIRIALDGRRHRVVARLEGVAAHVTPESHYVLQIVAGSQVYGTVRTTATVAVRRAAVALPTVR